MADWDALGEEDLLVSEHEILFCVRDLLRVYMEQQMRIHGRTTEELSAILAVIEGRVEGIEEILNYDFEHVQ